MNARIWLPVVSIAVVTLIGLVLALMADESWNWLCALLLAPSAFVAFRTMALLLKGKDDPK